MMKLPTPQVSLLPFTTQVPTTTGQHLDPLVCLAIHHPRMEPHTRLEVDHHLDLVPRINPRLHLLQLIKLLVQVTIQARHMLHPHIHPVEVHPTSDPRLPSNQSCHPQQDQPLTQVAWLDPLLFHHLPTLQVHLFLTNQSNLQSVLTVVLTLLVDLTLLNKVLSWCLVQLLIIHSSNFGAKITRHLNSHYPHATYRHSSTFPHS